MIRNLCNRCLFNTLDRNKSVVKTCDPNSFALLWEGLPCEVISSAVNTEHMSFFFWHIPNLSEVVTQPDFCFQTYVCFQTEACSMSPCYSSSSGTGHTHYHFFVPLILYLHNASLFLFFFFFFYNMRLMWKQWSDVSFVQWRRRKRLP